MPAPLLSTKLYIPSPRPEFINRSRLIEQLNTGLSRKLTLISAPAGFGKTTILSTWAHQSATPTAWLSLDESENDPALFLAYLLTAVLSVVPEIGKEILENLHSPQPDLSEATLISIINKISAAHPNDFVLILDDYHLITTSTVHTIINFFIDHMPLEMHLIIATRADPDLQLPRLRGRAEMVEIRQDDLRFSTSEVTVLINQMLGLKLSSEDIGALTARTEGWIAGLQMAVLSMSGKPDISQFIKEFTGSDRYILDYLMDEVFQAQPIEIQDFLLKTSLVTRLTASLCHSLTGVQNSQLILEHLERNNLFIIPLDNERIWYRYHRLFTDLLLKRLTDLHSDQISELHQRASSWYAANGFIPEAIQHALAAQDYLAAIELIAQVAETILMQSELTTLLKWLQVIPDETIRQYPVLCVYYAYILYLYGYPLETIESYLGISESTEGINKGYAAAFRSLIAVVQRDIPSAAKLARHALKHLPEDEHFFRIMALWVQSAADLVSGDFVGGFFILEEVTQQSRAVGNIMVSTIAACNQGKLCVYRGELTKAKQLFHQALGYAKNREGEHFPIAGEAFFGLGELYYEWNQLDAALEFVENGLQLSDRWGTFTSVDGLITKAKIFRAKGDIESTHKILLDAHALAVASDATVLDDYKVAAYLADLWLAQENLSTALDWVVERNMGMIGNDGKLIVTDTLAELDRVLAGDFLTRHLRRSVEFFTLSRVLVVKNQYTEALEILDRMLISARQLNLSGREILVQTLIAITQYKRGDRRSALAALISALQLAEPEGYQRVFLNEGYIIKNLLEEAAQQKANPAYLNTLLTAFGGDGTKPSPEEQILVDPLSEREMEILRLLPTKLTAPEIAEKLYVADSTVRTHIKHIYSKLNVNRRFEAVERARELGLL